MFAGATQAQPVPSEPPSQTGDSSIGYGSVQDALAALRSKAGTEVLERDGWILVQDRESEKSMTLWSFAPPAHAAYPSAVKRTVLERDGAVRIEMKVLCEAQKDACDQLVRQFQELTDRMTQRFNDAR
jgi:hypothetical protein